MTQAAETIAEAAPLAPDAGAPASSASSAPSSTYSRARASANYWTLVVSHTVIDLFPILFTSLLWPLQERLDLTPWQVRFVIMATPIFSGLLQPLFAWLTDKHDTRLFGPVGLALSAVCIGSIGLAQTFWQLAVLQVIGVIAVGMYHPVATALAGQSGSSLLRNGRAQAIGVFICGGMVGHALGSKVGPWINSLNDGRGMPYLLWLVPPALILAIVLQLRMSKVRHRHDNHSEIRASFGPGESVRRWRVISVLTAQNALRFTVNVGLLVIMPNVWAKSKLIQSGAFTPAPGEPVQASARALAAASSVHVGSLGAALTIGMGIVVMLSGRFFQRGRERAPLLVLSLIGAFFTAALGPFADYMHAVAGFGPLAMAPVYVCTGLTAIGFFATFPIATSLAQRLQPGHTSLVTSLMMGIGWGISSLAAPFAELMFGGVNINDAPFLEPWRINMGFLGFGALLVIAGALTLFIPKDLVAKAADHH